MASAAMRGSNNRLRGDARPSQVVIMAGGRGNRLMPLTRDLPKGMICFHRRPFLEYLVEMFRECGFREILFLLGYRAAQIRDHFGDGRAWGLSIRHSEAPVEDETGGRLRKAASLLDPIFLLSYCDNYWPIRFGEMWRQYLEAGAPAQLTVYRNDDGYTRNNLRLDDSGFVTCYDKSRTADGLCGVDIGFVLMRRSVLDLLPDANVPFEQEVYPRLADQRLLHAFVTDHRYYSVGSIERLGAMEEFLARRPAILLDRDGVLNRRMLRGEYVRAWADWEWLPGALDALRRVREAGWRAIVVTNQAGVARGHLTEGALNAIHERMCAEALQAGGRIDGIYFCPHGWEEGCSCRKPKPGLLFRAQRDFALDLTRTCFVGDDERDAQAAEAAGCPFVLFPPGQSLSDIVAPLLDKRGIAGLRRERVA